MPAARPARCGSVAADQGAPFDVEGPVPFVHARPRREWMRKNKLAGAISAVGVALVAAAAMGPAAEAAPKSPQASKLNVVFVAALVNDSYFVTIKCGALAAGKQLGV